MKLYLRDYKELTNDEKSQFNSLKSQEIVSESGNLQIKRLISYPKFFRHHTSLFPNNYLDIVDLDKTGELNDKLISFKALLNIENVKELDILRFINNKEDHAYFIIASLLRKYFNFRDSVHLFPEFQLGNTSRADYLIIGQNSGGYEFVFVELEAPKGRITHKNGDLGAVFDKGVKQVESWRSWLERNFSLLQETFNRSKLPANALPDEFIKTDQPRIHFVVIAGRRDDFDERTYEIRRREKKDKNFWLLHYDNLIDAATDVITNKSY